MRVVIVGAGIAGLTLAWWLEHAGWDVLVVEKAPEFRAGGYLIDFFGPGYEVARQMGLEDELKRLGAPISSVTYVDGRGRRRSEIGAAAYQSVADKVVSLLRGDLAQTLLGQVRAEVRFGTTVAAIEQGDRVRVELTDGTVEHADLLVGADGLHSRVRELVFGPEERFVRHLGYRTTAFSVEHDRLSERIGPRYQLLTEPGVLVGCYAAQPGHLAAFLLYRNEIDEFADLGWVTPELLRIIPPDAYTDQVSQVEMGEWHHGRVVLVGDACGAVSLFAGHGASLAMTGAYVLAQELATSMPEALGRYEERMRPAVTNTQRFGRRFIEWLAPSTRWRIVARDLFLKFAALPGMHRFLDGAVMPDTGDVLIPDRVPSAR